MGHKKKMEGNEQQRRAAGREARAEGKLPSEAGATLGASKQRRKTSSSASQQERLEARDHGKLTSSTSGKPRPGGRDTDPKRTDGWE
jgi:hypothetical protein